VFSSGARRARHGRRRLVAIAAIVALALAVATVVLLST
jgi:hypothetical protein